MRKTVLRNSCFYWRKICVKACTFVLPNLNMKKALIGLALVAATTLATSCKKEETPQPTNTTPTKTFTEVQLTKVTLNNIPFVDGSGSGWDISNGPDVYINLTETSTSTTATLKANKIDDVVPASLPLWWLFTTPVTLDTASNYMIDVYDADSPDADDYIGFTGFDLSELKNKNYPDSLVSTYQGITATLHFKYQ